MNIDFLHMAIGNDGLLTSNTLAKKIHITKSALAEPSALSKDVVSNKVLEVWQESRYGR